MSRTLTTRTMALLAAGALIAAACGGDDDAGFTANAGDTQIQQTTTRATETTLPATTVTEAPLSIPPRAALNYDEFRAFPTACGAEQPPPRQEMQFASPDNMSIDPDSLPTATISTSCGDIVVALRPDLAPATVNSFVFLAEAGYFDGSVSHRIVPGFVLQAGDPTATGRGGPGYVIPDEFPPPEFVYERGVLAMANAGPGTTGSQFFIMFATAGLPPQFSVFGQVVEGFDTLDTIATLPLVVGPGGNEQSSPIEALYLESVSVAR